MSRRTKLKARNKRNRPKEIIITRLLPLNRKGQRAVVRAQLLREGKSRLNRKGLFNKTKTSNFALNWRDYYAHYVADHEKYVAEMEKRKQRQKHGTVAG